MATLIGLTRLAERVRVEQDRWLSQFPVWRRARREHEERSLPHLRSVPRQVVWALAAVPVALGIGLLLRAVSATQSDVISASIDDIAYTRGDPIRANAAPVLLDFSDGSSVVLKPSTRASVDDMTSRGAEVTIATGGAEVHVVPGHQTRWLLNVGPFRVRVTGTRFAVNWDPDGDQFEIAMTEGSVVVSGCKFGSKGQRVSAHETLRATCSEELARAGSSAEPMPTEGTPEAALAARSEPTAPRRTSSDSAASRQASRGASEEDWLTLAQRGEYAASYRLLGPIFEAQLATRGAAHLGLMADVARLSGHWDRAEHAYRTLRTRFADSSHAASAAFSLARLAFDQRRSYAEAARWFQVYLNEEPEGAFAREALGRRVEALERAGDASAARREGARYLKLYPEGPHARAVRGLLHGP